MPRLTSYSPQKCDFVPMFHFSVELGDGLPLSNQTGCICCLHFLLYHGICFVQRERIEIYPCIYSYDDWPPHLLPCTSVSVTSGAGSRVNRVSGTNGTSVINCIPGLSRMFAHLTGNITCHCRPYTSSLSMYRRWRLLTPYRRLFSGSNARIVNKVGSRA